MLACISGSAFNIQETMSTLNYASSAKNVTNKAKANAGKANMEQAAQVTQLRLELADRLEEIEALKAEVDELRAQVASGGGGGPGPAASVRAGAAAATVFGATGVGAGAGSFFIGRAKLSLKNCVLQQSSYNTLPLAVTNPDWDGASLIINSWPVVEGGEPEEYEDLDDAIKALAGKRFDFCVHVISAEGIPEEFSKRVFCRYVFAKKEQKPLQTEDMMDTTDPKWDYKKRFAWSEFTKDLGEYLSGNVLTFEVIGHSS